jgi:Protein related to penicillin acylase
MSEIQGKIQAIHHLVDIRRNEAGVPCVKATSWIDALYGLGWLHGCDRGGQVCLSRIVAAGRLCELLRDDPMLLELDCYYRRIGFRRHAKQYADTLDPTCGDYLEAYCQGMSNALTKHPPRILRWFGYRPEPCTRVDVLALIKLMAYASLAEAQRLIELFIIEAVRRGVDDKKLQALFPALNTLELEMIRGLAAIPELFPTQGLLAGGVHGLGSNSWVVSGVKTESGAPILCNDPHLEVNRLPAILYEVQIHVNEEWTHGATVPGLPGLLTGRNRSLAWGVTYAFPDSSDFFVERCTAGCYLREGEWRPFVEHRERILRKKHDPVDLLVYENPHGILEGDPHQDGDYLCWGWSGLGGAGLGTLKAFLELMRSKSVAEGQVALRQAEIPGLNIVLADRSGNIGYQMVGHVPRRRSDLSGLAPVAGWQEANDWQGWLDPFEELPSSLNPTQGYLATANEARQKPGGPLIATLPQPEYRHTRINALIESKVKLGVTDMQTFHYDVLSLQAERLRPVFLAYLPEGPQRRLLAHWDLRYTPDSEAATLFENIYYSVVVEVFGEGGFGGDWLRYLINETLLFVALFGFFDDILCRSDSAWLPAEHRDAILSRAITQGLENLVEPWGKRNRVTFQNLFLGGRMPRLLGFDPGPYPLPGSRATVCQGTRMRHAGKETSFAPCYRFVTDLGTDESWTNIPGGPSESRFSHYYTSELASWFGGEYKRLKV